jgi:hypothetical protein
MSGVDKGRIEVMMERIEVKKSWDRDEKDFQRVESKAQRVIWLAQKSRGRNFCRPSPAFADHSQHRAKPYHRSLSSIRMLIFRTASQRDRFDVVRLGISIE